MELCLRQLLLNVSQLPFPFFHVSIFVLEYPPQSSDTFGPEQTIL